MAEAVPARSGAALRVYQVLGVLAAGWMLGRLPQLLADNRAEEARLQGAIGAMSAPAGPGRAELPAGSDPSAIAAQVAATVAAQVADQTVARLIAAGWGPRADAPQTIVIRDGGAGRSAPTVVHIVTDRPAGEALAGLDYRLPPGSAANGPATAPSRRADPAPASAPPASSTSVRESAAHAVAGEGYAALAAGDRRRGVDLLATALRMEPDGPQSAAWAADVRRLTKKWAVSAYTLSRGAGNGDALAASPVLGASQSGAAVVYTFDPLARRPLSAFGRITGAADPGGSIDGRTAEAAVGLRVQPLAGIPVAVDVERRIALGYWGRNAWAARVSGGTSTNTRIARFPATIETYAEGGVVGIDTADLYGGLQGRIATPLIKARRISLDVGGGAWAAAQRSFGFTTSRVDLGPSMRLRMLPYPFFAQVDYRVRTAGNALPGSGLALTVAGEF